MVLSDVDIIRELDAGRLVISPLADNAIQPASVDVRLAPEFLIYPTRVSTEIRDPRDRADNRTIPLLVKDSYILRTGEMVLTSTIEDVGLPVNILGRIEGKSSLGRAGLMVHITAGFVDPGWRGRLTMEMYNCSPFPLLLTPGMKISQLSFWYTSTDVERPYGTESLGSKYQGQQLPML